MIGAPSDLAAPQERRPPKELPRGLIPLPLATGHTHFSTAEGGAAFREGEAPAEPPRQCVDESTCGHCVILQTFPNDRNAQRPSGSAGASPSQRTCLVG